jgi:methionyl-tRNA formyltransferase
MKLAVLTIGDSIDCYIISELKKHFDVVGVLQFYDTPAKHKTSRNPLRVLLRLVRGISTKWFLRVDAWVTRVGWLELSPPPILDATRIPAAEVNQPITTQRIRDWGADYLILLGSPMLRKEIFEAPRVGTINMHYGIAPFYRGGYTLFWSLLRNDIAGLGITAHFVDGGVDTGQILGRAYPALQPNDNEATLTVACARIGARMLVDILEKQPQPSEASLPRVTGHYFRYSDRKIWHDILFWTKRFFGMKLPRKAAQINLQV